MVSIVFQIDKSVEKKAASLTMAAEQKEPCFEMGPETHTIPMTLFANNRYLPTYSRSTILKRKPILRFPSAAVAVLSTLAFSWIPPYQLRIGWAINFELDGLVYEGVHQEGKRGGKRNTVMLLSYRVDYIDTRSR